MKNKVVNVLLSGLFLFFIVLGVVKAEDASNTIVIPSNGNPVQFIDGTMYSGAQCSGTENLQLFEVSKKSSGGYDVKMKSGINATSGSENLVCTYKIHYGMIGDTLTKLDMNGSLNFTFTFSTVAQDTKVNATLSKYSPILEMQQYLANFSYVESVDLGANSNYLENNCSGNMCSFKVKDETFNSMNGQDITVNGKFVYVTIDGQKVTVTLNIVIKGFYNIVASAGNYGTCNFDTSIWSPSKYSSNSYTAKYDESTMNSISLPNCSSENSAHPNTKFVGWTYADPNSINKSQNVQVSNTCKNYPVVSGNLKQLIESGVDKFYACYETGGFLILRPAGGTVAVQPSWIANDSQSTHTQYTIVQDTPFVLPEITAFPGSLNAGENTEVEYYWKSSDGNKYQPGQSVEPKGQTISAIYKTKTTIDLNKYEYSVMYAGDTQVYALSGITFDTCSSNSGAVSVSNDGESGGCLMKANSDTGDSTIEITATSGDKTYTLYLKVKSRAGTTETVTTTKTDFVIQFRDYAIAGYASSGEIKTHKKDKDKDKTNSTKTSTDVGDINSNVEPGDDCENYSATVLFKPDDHKIVEFSVTKTNSQYDVYNGTFNAVLGHSEFTVKCADANTTDTNEYGAICIDPSAKTPPDTANLKKIDSSKVSSSVRNFLYAAIQDPSYQKAMTTTKENTQDKVSVTFVARLLAAGSGNIKVVPTDGKTLIAAYLGFKHLYDTYHSNWGDLVSDTKAKGYKWDTSNYVYSTPIETLLKKMPLSSASSFAEVKQSNVQVDTGDEEGGESGEGSSGESSGPHLFTFTGDLELPSDIKMSEVEVDGAISGGNVKAKMECADGLTCELKSISDSNFEFTVEFEDEKLLKDPENIKMYLYFKSYSLESSIIFLEIPGDAYTQRLAIFKAEQVYLFTYGGDVTFNEEKDEDGDDECHLEDFPSDGKFTDEQKKEWKDKDCCQLITDQNDKRYQKYCGADCTKVTYDVACDPDSTTGDGKYELYTVREGYSKDDGGDKIGACVVDVTKAKQNKDDNRENTDDMTDAVGNFLAITDFSDNQYCRVSCKEDWNLKTPGFKNFVGEEGAIKAGQYFRLNEEILLSGTRTCVTTYIDYDHYKDDVKILSGQMVAAYNTYVEAVSAYNSAKNGWSEFYEYQNDNQTVYHPQNPYSGDDTKYVTGYKLGNPHQKCTGGWAYTQFGSYCQGWETFYNLEPIEDKCDIYNVHVKKGDAIEDTVYDNKEINGKEVSGQKVHGESYSTTVNYGGALIGQEVPADFQPPQGDGTCQSKDENLSHDDATFERLLQNITYKSKNEKTTSFKDYKRYDGDPLEGDEWDTIEGTLGDPKKNPGTIVTQAKQEMVRLKQELNDKAEDFGACQNFYMFNTNEDEINEYFNPTEDEHQIAYKGKGTAYDAGEETLEVDRIEIASPYNPIIRYQYEEWEYMTLIGEYNYLIPDKRENNKVVGEEPQNVCEDTEYETDDGDKVQICVNKIDTYSYKSEDGWDNDDEDGKSYGGDDGKNEGEDNVQEEATEEDLMICLADDEAKCESGKFYFYEINYIKQTLSNGGFYKNYGDFFISQYSDIKIFAQTRDEAAGLASAAGSTADDWGPLGGNSFPIGIDTRRNIYQYMFSFGQIGIYNQPDDSGCSDSELGRIMGGCSDGKENLSTISGGESATSIGATVVEGHTFACFYEVFEELCQCCGQPITTVAVMPSGVDTESYNSQYNFSDPSKVSESGTLGFYTSTVSLYDLDGIPGGDNNLPTNWSNDDSFTVYGNTYKTDKGGQLAEAIVSVGEEIYARTPEYSYTLTPAAMAEIRDYNGLNGYEHNIKNMTNAGVCAIAGSSQDCAVELGDFEEDEIIIFAHYASKFLEEVADQYTTQGQKNLSTRGNKICQVSSGQLGSGKNYIDMANGSYSNCRWVDYVMTKSEASFIKGDDTIAEMDDVTHFRLAFK